MKHYSEQEIDEKIQTFLSKKLQKYPELSTKPAIEHPTALLRMPKITHSLIWTTVR